MTTLLASTAPYRRGEKVRATRDLPGVPDGTGGRVRLANGVTWARYWVQFDNGEWLGHVDHADLVRAKDWGAHPTGPAEASTAAGADADTDGGDAAASPEGVEVNGVTVPGFLLDRSRAARDRLGA